MIEVSDKCKASLDMRVQLLSDGVLNKATQRDAVRKWLDCDFFSNMRAETLRKALRECKAGRLDLTPEQIEMIELRLLTAKSSTAKCQTAINLAGPDKRIRGAITFNGGGRIGRFSHKGFQPGNLPRPSKEWEDKDMVANAIEVLLQ
jgi:DNA polymerase